MKVKDGWRLDGVLAVSRSLGDSHFKKSGLSAEPEISRIEITPDDQFLLLATDGLISNQGMKKVTESILNLKTAGCGYGEIAQQLCQAAVSNAAKDNVTLVIIDV